MDENWTREPHECSTPQPLCHQRAFLICFRFRIIFILVSRTCPRTPYFVSCVIFIFLLQLQTWCSPSSLDVMGADSSSCMMWYEELWLPSPINAHLLSSQPVCIVKLCRTTKCSRVHLRNTRSWVRSSLVHKSIGLKGIGGLSHDVEFSRLLCACVPVEPVRHRTRQVSHPH